VTRTSLQKASIHRSPTATSDDYEQQCYDVCNCAKSRTSGNKCWVTLSLCTLLLEHPSYIRHASGNFVVPPQHKAHDY